MTIVNLSDLTERLHDLLIERVSREEVSSWASSLMELEDIGELEYVPKQQENQIWQSILFLAGVDLLIAPGKYLHNTRDIEKVLFDISIIQSQSN